MLNRLPHAEYACAAGMHDTKSRMRVCRRTMTREGKRFRRKQRRAKETLVDFGEIERQDSIESSGFRSKSSGVDERTDIRLASDAIGESIYLSREISISAATRRLARCYPYRGQSWRTDPSSPLRANFLEANVPQR